MYIKKILIIFSLLYPYLMGRAFAQNAITKTVNPKNIPEIKYDVQIEKNYFNHDISIFLMTNNVKTDSIVLHNIDFENETLVCFNNIWWHYVFSECVSCSPSLQNSSQLILTPFNGKLFISFVSQYIRSIERDSDSVNFSYDSVLSDSNQFFFPLKNQYCFYDQIKIDSLFFNGNYMVDEIFYSYRSGDTHEEAGFVKKHIIKFDAEKKIFYNEKKLINANCTFELEVNGRQEKKRLHNVEVPVLNFYHTCFAYYNGKWYFYFNNFFRPLDILTSTCRYDCVW